MNKIFKSQAFLLLCTALTMLSNLSHSAELYYKVNNDLTPKGLVIAYVVNLVVDLSVLVFVFYGKHRIAMVYALAVFVINMLYYGGAGMFYNTVNADTINSAAARIIYSALFTYGIYIFSKMMAEHVTVQQNKAEVQQTEFVLQQIENVKHEVAASLQHVVETVQQLNQGMEQIAAKQIEADEKLQQLGIDELKLNNVLQTVAATNDRLAALEETQPALRFALETFENAEKERQQKLVCKCGFAAKNERALTTHRNKCAEHNQKLAA